MELAAIGDGFLRHTVAKVVFITMLVNYVIKKTISFNVLFTVVDTLTVGRFYGLIGRMRKVRMGGHVYVLDKVFLFLYFFCFKVSPSRANVFVPCLTLFVCLVIDRLCLGGRGPLGG